jgi:hypothetical protein
LKKAGAHKLNNGLGKISKGGSGKHHDTQQIMVQFVVVDSVPPATGAGPYRDLAAAFYDSLMGS